MSNNRVNRANWAAVVFAGCLALFTTSCLPTSTPESANASFGGCDSDRQCPMGEECSGNGCTPAVSTLYPHIQLASALFRAYVDDNEKAWRAAHHDLLIGMSVEFADELRSHNPSLRMFEYFTPRYYRNPAEAEAWASANGHDVEDFYLHYREDVFISNLSSFELVPGFPPGVIPGWNPTPSPNDPPASATSRDQARVMAKPPSVSEGWYFANVDNGTYRRFVSEYTRNMIDGSAFGVALATGPISGVLIDHAVYYPQFNEGQLGKTEEFYGVPLDDDHPYGAAFETLYGEQKREFDLYYGQGKDILANYGHTYWLSQTDRFSVGVQQVVDWVWGEVWMTYWGFDQPQSGSNRVITYEADYENGIANVVRQTRAGGRRIIGALDLLGGGLGSDRGRIFTLALYYLVHNKNVYYAYQTVRDHVIPVDISRWQWNPVVEVDIGAPSAIPSGALDFEGVSGSSEHYEFATGSDPFDPTRSYLVFARRFANGMVLAKMLPQGSVVDDRSITVHVLDQPYRLVQGDGTLGPTVTEVSLRNNEGAILVIP